MRAILLVAVLLMWGWCVVGAVGLTVYLAAVAAGAVRRPGRQPSPPARGAVPALVVYAAVMAICGVMLAGITWRGPEPEVAAAVAWAALPAWSAAVAVATALVLARRRRPA